ncbi:selenocysteine-specific elongation factor [Ochlerotatus camptorhynchus]|uniref:selenocysteine-specific elongation factor n=1 Tax=Ochlerotatus camptorhynchus TaxID=644619 RepID=UPI0031DDCA9E
MLNLNVGILGHVDSGKTTLAKALSGIASTAAFDKNPQSQQRGITLDLGFSALLVDLPDHLKAHRDGGSEYDRLQYTFVDCPGHASLIRTIIGGAQIIDMMILVVDIGKGIQTQTAECLVIGELTCRKMIVALNKIDTLEEDKRVKVVEKMKKGLGMALSKTIFASSPIIEISAASGLNLERFVEALKGYSFVPERTYGLPFLFAVDHCFTIKGQGTVCTGTVLQGQIKLNEDVEIPKLKLVKKVKSMQMFKQSQQIAKQGDRIGICITQFDPKLLERGLLCYPGYVSDIYAAVLQLNPIQYYKGIVKHKAKFHITCGYETVMGTVILFKGTDPGFTIAEQYEFLEELGQDAAGEVSPILALLEFERPIQAVSNALVIGSKLDTDIHSSLCRLAFHGKLEYSCTDKDYSTSFLPQLNIFKEKRKTGTVQRVVNETELIAAGLFKKTGNNRQAFLGLKVQLSTGECGVIEDSFGTTSKVRLRFMEPLGKTTLDLLNKKGASEQVKVEVKYKKYLFRKDGNKVVQ